MAINLVYFDFDDTTDVNDIYSNLKDYQLSLMKEENFQKYFQKSDFDVFNNIDINLFETPYIPKELFFLLITFGISDNSIIYYRGYSKYWLSSNKLFFPLLKITDDYIVISQSLNFKKIERLKNNMKIKITDVNNYNLLRDAVFTAYNLPFVIPFETTYLPPITGQSIINKAKPKVQYYFHYNPESRQNNSDFAKYIKVDTDMSHIDDTDIEMFNVLYKKHLNELVKLMFSNSEYNQTDNIDELDKWIENMNKDQVYQSYKTYLDMYMESYLVKRKELEELGISESKIKQIEKKWFKL